ncbi:hypothetical protein FQV37_2549 [Psychrobacter nivimaris]|uniref:Uncharacterized protein n=1 Tax=Psychrobacter nivimaris TaxID=281738 RepID=A0A6N7C0X8_9GAMM|nr:hypothetical protein [Psychrobacter nivimaris]KAF0569524.1 hypothetical protein FQV37_2549 [Psychrobacter nivimaris]
MATITGRAKRYDGLPIDYVLIFRWKDGKCLGKSIPNNAGNWLYKYDTNMIVGITYVADGCEPITHGPYEFVVQV